MIKQKRNCIDSLIIIMRSGALSFVVVYMSCWGMFLSSAADYCPEECKFDTIFNFGDSNSDTGGLYAAFPPSVLEPYGHTFFKEPCGRYSDGRVTIDFIAKSFDLPFLSSYLDSMGTKFSHGANFATSAATITLPDGAIPVGEFSPFFLVIQSLHFARLKSLSESKKLVGKIPNSHKFKEALYTFDIGQNDLTMAFKLHKTVQEANATVPDIVNTFSKFFTKIYKESGGSSFWIHNTGPIGCLSSILTDLPTSAKKDEAGCAKSHNEVAQHFNAKLKEAVVQLRKDFPDAAITYVDVYSAKFSFFKDPEKYGFDWEPLVTCCGSGGNYNFNRKAVCGMEWEGKKIGSCENPEAKVLWDGIHYTEAANKAVFNLISTGEFSYPPVPLKKACRRSA